MQGSKPIRLATPESEVCTNLELIPPDLTEIFPYLGYPRGTSPGSRTAEHLRILILESLRYLDPRGTFSIYPVTKPVMNSLRLGEVTIRGDVAKFMSGADRVAVFAVTIGETISTRSTAMRRAGDAFGAWVMDAFGSWAAEAAADALMHRLQRRLHAGEALTLRYSPGYCGMAMSQQKKLFALLNTSEIDVTLLPSLLMQPLKSISGLVGIGPQEKIGNDRSACDRCPQVDCHMRR